MSEVRLALALFAGLSVPVFLAIGGTLTVRTGVWLLHRHDANATLLNQARALVYIVCGLTAQNLWNILTDSGEWP